MINKKLLSKVLELNINSFFFIDKSICTYEYGFFYEDIGIYELAFKCKQWAKSKGYYILSGYDESSTPEAIINHTYSGAGCYCDESLKADTEPGSTFKACQWILNYKDN